MNRLHIKQLAAAASLCMAIGSASAMSGIQISSDQRENSAKQSAVSLAEIDQVKTSLINMINALDSKQWSVTENAFTEQVFVDYSSLNKQPGTTVAAADLVNGWQTLLAKVDTHHILSNFQVSIEGDTAESYSHVYASHTAKGFGFWDAYGRYHQKLIKTEAGWKITSMSLIMHGQKGNNDLLKEVNKMHSATVKKVSFMNDGQKLVGNLYLPADYDASKQYPAVIVSGSWTTVKEQMAGLYAEKLAQQGFLTLAFDFRNFGESEGEPRFYENPSSKVEDIGSAVSYLQTLSQVDNDKIGAMGICAGSMYTLMAAAKDSRIKSVVTAASWLHDAEAVKLFYGGEEGVQSKIKAAKAAKAKYQQTGEVDYIAAISTTDESAAMFGPYDYYLNPERGAVKQWSADKFAVMSWDDWLNLDPMPSAKQLQIPTLMIHSDGAVLPDYTKKYFQQINTEDKQLYWMETELDSPFHQFNFYDKDKEVNESVAQAKRWFTEKM